jgi:TRAP-type mannitol/chloroaromatic compound transport system permease small subunit
MAGSSRPLQSLLAGCMAGQKPTMTKEGAPMTVQRVLYIIDGFSTWVGKAASWLILMLMTVVCVEVFKRYLLNAPTAWIFDLNNMLYGTLFMLAGAYTLAQNAHVRGDFLYSSMKPRTQALLDLILYIVFFVPGIAALIYAGSYYAADSWRIDEHSNVTADGPPIYHFKTVIPIAGALVMLQGIAEIIRCVVCLRTGVWPSRLKDVAEIDVVEEQLAQSEYIDAAERKAAIERAQHIDETARQRGMGGDLQT